MFARSSNLTDMCLQVIDNNLELFIFSKTTPQKHIDFLHRQYSADVFKRYNIRKSNMKEDCMLWFLNPHVKKVTLPRNLYSEKIIKQLQIIGPGITTLNLRSSRATENDLNSIICSVRHVKHLDLSYTSCTDKTLLCVHEVCPDLESLNLCCCSGITDNGMENLCGGNLSLKSLNIECTDIESFGIGTILKGMPSLECIKCGYLDELLYEMCGKKVSQYNLTELVYEDIYDKPLEIIQTSVKMFPKIKKVHFTYPVEKTVLKACTGFKNLEELKIKMSHSFYVDIQVYNVLTPILSISGNLKTLILSCVQIPVVTLIECFRNLENLYLKNVSFADFEKEDIKVTETKLNTLVIKDTNMELSNATYKSVVLLISLSKHVTKLYLCHIKSLPDGIFDAILSSMKNLTIINFSYTFVELHSMLPLFNIPSMKLVFANSFEDVDSTIKNTLAHKSACTLSWRCMFDPDEEEEEDDDGESDYDDDFDGGSYYDDGDGDSNNISDHVSDQCNSDESEKDDYLFRRNYGAAYYF